MNEIWILLLLIVTAALPVILVFWFFRLRKLPVTLPWFLVSLAAGVFSVLLAALIQSFVPDAGGGGLFSVFFNVFFRIALIEELSRFVILIPLFSAVNRRRNIDVSFCAALGLVAGLGFAMLENAFFGLADINITLLRAVTAAPVHGACGIRIGAAVFLLSRHPTRAFFTFASAVLIHGAYNLMIISPALPSFLAVFVAFTAFLSSLSLLKPSGSERNTL